MKKKVLTVIAVVALAIVMTIGLVSCNLNKSMADYNKRGEFIVGFDAEQAPMGFIQNGQYVGFDIELAKAVGEELGLNVKLQPISWGAKEMEIKSGKIDVIWNGFSVDEQRKKQFDFSLEYMVNKQIAIVKSDSKYTDMDSLINDENLAVGYQTSSTAESAVKSSKLNNKKLTGFEDNNIAVTQELASGRVNCVVMDSTMAYFKFGDNSDYRILANVELATENYAVGFRKGETEFRDAVNAALVKLYNNGTVKEVFDRYFTGDMDDLIIIPSSL